MNVFNNKKPESLWEERIREIIKEQPKSDMEKLLDLVSIALYSQKNDDLSKLYSEIGLNNFAKVINLFSQRTIRFPDKNDLQDTIMTSLCYYFREIRGLSWDEIKKIFNFREFSSIKYGKGISKMKSIMEDVLHDKLEDIYGEEFDYYFEEWLDKYDNNNDNEEDE